MEPSTTPAGATGGMLLGVDAEVAIPVGDWSNAAGLGFGALGRFEFNAAPKLNITGRIGYIYFLGKDTGFGTSNVHTIPILGGVKYDLTDAIYGAAELGLFNTGISAEVDLGAFGGKQTVSSSTTKLGATIGAGMHLGDLDARAGLQILSLGDAGESMMVGLNLGYNFWRK
jgi:hypothetical protein